MFNEHMEVVSLVGTLSCLNGHHLHMSLSNKDGKVIGGHLFGETRVFTTLEVTIGECLDLEFQRELDAETGFDELVVKQANVS